MQFSINQILKDKIKKNNFNYIKELKIPIKRMRLKLKYKINFIFGWMTKLKRKIYIAKESKKIKIKINLLSQWTMFLSSVELYNICFKAI